MSCRTADANAVTWVLKQALDNEFAAVRDRMMQWLAMEGNAY
jgi:hypothetical protein